MNVLLVVADSALEQQLKEFFTGRHRGVVPCADVHSARQQLAEHPFAFVLIDLEVEGGAELCGAVRELSDGRTTLCLVLTPEETVQALRGALAAGADDYLRKPVDLTALQLRLALGERRLTSRQERQTQDSPPREPAEKALHSREKYFRSLLENSSDLITIVDIEGHVLYQTPSSQHLLGWNADEMMGWNIVEHLHPEDREKFSDTLWQSVRDSVTPTIQCRIRHRDGHYRFFESLFKGLLTDPVIQGVIVTSRDISEHRRLESELVRERAFFQQLFRNSPTGIVILDPEDRVVDANHSFLKLFQYELAEIRRRPINDCIVPEELREEALRLSASVLRKESVSHETSRQRKDGSAVDVSVIAYPIEIRDRLVGAFGMYSDITQRKKIERQLFHSAYHDPLTGLPNRALLIERVNRALEQVEHQPDYRFALVFIDLDRFKIINDSLGHEAGDELLKEMARRLEECVRPGDTTARLGGDEFTIILEDLQDLQDATTVADQILESLARPFHIAGQEIGNSGSIGIAYSGTTGEAAQRYENADDILRDADIAMYKAKSAGKAQYAIFDAEMHKLAMRRIQLETHLRRAIENEELVLYYQPIVSLKTLEVSGFEALVRWVQPSGKIVEAGELIPICEETGLIVDFGRWALRQAVRQAVDWQRRFPDSNGRINVNLSAKEMVHPDFMEGVKALCEESGIRPKTLGLEMTETVMMSDKNLSQILLELRELGFRLYVDDFGTGQASLSALSRFPVDALKIDRSFIRQMAGGENQEIVRAIAALGTSLGLPVIAEGVETKEQLAQVMELEIQGAQGLLFSEPLPAAEAERLLTGGPLADR